MPKLEDLSDEELAYVSAWLTDVRTFPSPPAAVVEAAKGIFDLRDDGVSAFFQEEGRP